MKVISRTLVAAAWAVAGMAPPALAQAVESTDPIKLTIHDWTGQYITTHIMGEVLKSMGYNVEYVQADYLAQFAGLETGDVHVAMEMWETTGKDALEASLKTGKTVDLGETGMQANHTAYGVDLAAAAAACGFVSSTTIADDAAVARLRDSMYAMQGPLFAQVKVAADKLKLTLPPRDGAHLKNRFREALLGADAHFQR